MDRICLITPYHVSLQPRALREADTLYEAGYDVRVVCRQVDPILSQCDQRLMQRRKWRLQPVSLCRQGPHRHAWFIESVRSKVCQKLFDVGLRANKLAIRGYVRGLDRLTALAAKEPASWFIAHTQAALPVAAAAAQRWEARLGFDCEDLLAERGTDPAEIVRLIERNYLPLCDYVSVPSHCIADQLIQDYGIRKPLVLYNVFPLSLADGLSPPMERPAYSTLRLHWFGQTLGPGRGIEDAIEAMGLINQNVELHLRGRLPAAYRSIVETLARQRGVARAVLFHPLVDHDTLIRTMDQFDVGLALERTDNPNTAQTVSNKLFSYLLAGLAVAATDTPGQREVLQRIPSVGFLYPVGNPAALADGLRRWMADPQALRDAQQSAWNAARERFCWDLEKQKLLQVIESDSGSSFAPVARYVC